MNSAEFQDLVWDEGRARYRDMPWRDEPTFYNVLVSELMLQQTQVSRVLVKFAEFMQRFPTIESLADAPLSEVLVVWSGLGYNRRAKFLHGAAQYVVQHGQPTTAEGLMQLPGVGANTAGALMNYVYETPTAFIETNIRTVYIHHFFADRADVTDGELRELVQQTLDTEHPRQWFWALMDYGSYLKSQGSGRLSQSKHYKKQSPLKGSVREVRGQILRVLAGTYLSLDDLRRAVQADERFDRALQGLLRDELVAYTATHYQLAGAQNASKSGILK